MTDMQTPPPQDPRVPDEGMVQCEVTGKWVPADEVVELQGMQVCAEGKAILLERMKAGEAMPGEFEPPTALRRIGCWLLDNILLGVVGFIIGMVLMFGFLGTLVATGGAGGTGGPGGAGGVYDPAMEQFVAGVAGILGGLISIAYYALLHAHRGQTVGKMAGRIRVVNEDGAPLSTGRAFYRAVFYPGPYLIPPIVQAASFGLNALIIVSIVLNVVVIAYVIADLVVMLADRREQRSLHDRLAGTRVIFED